MRSVVRIYPGPPLRSQISNFRSQIGVEWFRISDLSVEVEWYRNLSVSDWKSCPAGMFDLGAGWSSPVARWAHNPKVAGSNPAPATNLLRSQISDLRSQTLIRGCSSVGRAPRLQRGGQGFESPHLHQLKAISDLRSQISKAKLEQSSGNLMIPRFILADP